MKMILLSALLSCITSIAKDLPISDNEPLVVTAPEHWRAEKDKSGRTIFPLGTYRIAPTNDHNALCLVSIMGKDKNKFANTNTLKAFVRLDSRPYVASEKELESIEIRELPTKTGHAFYANFIDPDLVGKPIQPGSYKTATPVFLNLKTNYLLKITVLCDDLKDSDYKEMIEMIQSIKIAK